jgi:hypothetical protein
VSPESGIWEVARREQQRMSVLERPALFCAVCGAAMQQQVFGTIRREVWCAEKRCKQYQRKLNVFDRVLTGDSHE